MPNIADIGNKIKRQQVVMKMKAEKSKLQLKERMKRKKLEEKNPELRIQRLKENVPKTLETLRVWDETVVANDDEEIIASEAVDALSSHFSSTTPPKVLVTTTPRPRKEVYEFANEFVSLFPTAEFVKRDSKFTVTKMAKLAIEKGYTDLVVVNSETKKEVNSVTFMHLPEGPTLHFKVSSFISTKRISGHGRHTPHNPELILNNFNTRLGRNVGRLFATLFPQVPAFQGRQAITFHNQRDYIFVRRHRYIFEQDANLIEKRKDGKLKDTLGMDAAAAEGTKLKQDMGVKIGLQELGPRFTMKLRWVQKGIMNRNEGEYEWNWKPEMEKERRKFFL